MKNYIEDKIEELIENENYAGLIPYVNTHNKIIMKRLLNIYNHNWQISKFKWEDEKEFLKDYLQEASNDKLTYTHNFMKKYDAEP